MSTLSAPPLRVRWGLWWKVRVHMRTREFSEDWQPFTFFAWVLAVGGLVFNAVVMFGLLVLGGLWLSADRDRVATAQFLCSLGDGDQAACLRLMDGEVVAVVLVVAKWLTTVSCWLILLPAGLNLLVQFGWYLRSAAQRGEAWRESLLWEYAGDGNPARMALPGRHDAVFFGDVDWVRKWLRRLGARRRTGRGRDRLVHARRWAMAREAQSLANALAGIGGLCIATGLVLWHNGLIDTAAEVNPVEAARVLLIDYAWNIANTIPVLEITEALRWERPDLFADDRTWAVVLLVIKVLLVLPVLLYLAAIVRRRHDRTEPTAPHADDPVVTALFDRIGQSPFPLYYLLLGRGWHGLYGRVARDLHTDPGAYPTWNAPNIAAHLEDALESAPDSADR